MDLTGDRSHKITSRHLRRQAYLYIRQSTLRQVVETSVDTQNRLDEVAGSIATS
jgi:hypothetical protein